LSKIFTHMKELEKIQQIVQEAEALCITAGAGMGVDSGLPDFRGNEGFWKAYPPIKKLGISFVEMANPYWFEHNPRLAWGFYGHRLNLYRKTKPHQGFYDLLNLASSKPAGYFVFTSNVDGQFQQAGFDENYIEECHGSIHHLQCTVPCSPYIWQADDLKIDIDEERFIAADPLPACPKCGALARPNILMFGDWHWISGRSDQQAQRFSDWVNMIKHHTYSLVVIEIGAGEAVPTVRFKSESLARLDKAALIRINPRDDQVPSGHFSISAGGVAGINKILVNGQ
jgi:NAD-dependent SIR2 family protein deacetylase